ncbi:MAG: (Fe-S)-binding protein, partial [Anaerolineales bacterium]
SLSLAARAVVRISRSIARGQGRPDWSRIPTRLIRVLLQTTSFAPVFRDRRWVSLLHGMVGWGFIFYLLVNLGDFIQAWIPGFVFLGEGTLGGLYRLGADILSVAILLGMLGLLVRRFFLKTPELNIRTTTLLSPKARTGIRRDSAIVGIFILIHVGARFLGESFHLSLAGLDPWQPVASVLARAWMGATIGSLTVARHASWWASIGGIVVFLPYFLYSKHIHLFFAPINYLLHPERTSMGALDSLDFDDQSVEQFGAERIEHLSWKGILDAYACIMCNRCQDACPAYQTGKVLSPSALEINKRYFLNAEGAQFATGASSSQTLIEFALPVEAVWGCTTCGACIEVCPVGNEPMRDILEMRRHQVLMANDFPEQLQTAFRGMERSANPWNIPPEKRLDWAEGLSIPTIAEKPDAEYLWWVGCAPSTDPMAQKTARAFATLLQSAQVDFAVLGSEERCTGDSARRSGNEYLFFELANANVETLNAINPRTIITTCPHCLHTLMNEYPEFGGHYHVIHHTELLQSLIEEGRLPLQTGFEDQGLTFHDPCYLGRQNDILEAPRAALAALEIPMVEMPRAGRDSFCCGAGGSQMWKEEEAGERRVSEVRYDEAKATGQKTLAVGCPFCKIMLSDAAGSQAEMEIKDVAEILAERLLDGDSRTDPAISG